MIVLMVALMSVMASTPASAKTGNKESKDIIPTSIIVKQTTYFTDGRTLVIYYKKQGNQCEVYSPNNSKDYNMTDASKIKSSNFEVTDHVEGRCYKRCSVGEMVKLAKWLINKYL